MSKVIVTSIVSVDGYTEGPEGNVMVMPMDHAFDEYNAERMRAAGSLLLGGTTYRGFVGFWPSALENPELTPGSTEIAQRYADGIPITVVSDTLTEDETGPWRDQTTIVRRADAHEAIARLREQDGGDALIYGSRTLWGDLLAHGLVDELHLMVGPSLVAGDHHAFAGVPPTGLRLLGVRQWDGSDNVLLTYAVG
jgi:dihydrofolate reductase